MILLAVLPHFEHTLSSESAINLKAFSFELQEPDIECGYFIGLGFSRNRPWEEGLSASCVLRVIPGSTKKTVGNEAVNDTQPVWVHFHAGHRHATQSC